MDGVRLVRARALAALCSLALATLGACSRDGGAAAKGSAASNSGPYAKEVNDAVPRIEKAVGLPFKTPPKVERRSKDEVRSFLMQKFNESMPAAEISAHRAHVSPLRAHLRYAATAPVHARAAHGAGRRLLRSGHEGPVRRRRRRPGNGRRDGDPRARARATGSVSESRLDSEDHGRQRSSGRGAGRHRRAGDVRAGAGDARHE